MIPAIATSYPCRFTFLVIPSREVFLTAWFSTIRQHNTVLGRLGSRLLSQRLRAVTEKIDCQVAHAATCSCNIYYNDAAPITSDGLRGLWFGGSAHISKQ